MDTAATPRQPIASYVERRVTFGEVNGVPAPGEIWTMMKDDIVEAVNFRCPCGCGAECYTPVADSTKGLPKTEHEWLYSKGPNGPTLSPSIRYLGGCKAHFNITDGKAVMHWDSGK
jgi:hypothetical protein